jgi:phosphotransacetylase
MMNSFKDILDEAKQKGARKIVVPMPGREDIEILARAAASGLAIPYFMGRESTLKQLIAGTPLSSLPHGILDVADRKEALMSAIAYARDGHADMLMQGGIAHQPLMEAVLDGGTGLKKVRVPSYVSLFELLKREKLILVTDTFLNNQPGIVEKQAILENALRLARMLGIEEPKAAVLAAIEQVNPGIPSTLDAAILSKMSERKQFGKAIVEGPLDIDCALSTVAAKRKGLKSVVTGNVDIYMVPEIDTGHLLAESLVFFGRMQTAGVLMGTTKPVILNMPFVSDGNRLVEIALACMISHAEN